MMMYASEAAEREAARHGCCCKGCPLRSEIWICLFIDITSIIGLVAEIPAWYAVPADLHVIEELVAFLIFSVFSACLIAFALCKGDQAAWPRRLLVRFMSTKLPIFVVFCMGYWSVSPWAAPLAQWVCKRDFQQMRSTLGDENCVAMFPWFYTLNNAVYLPLYAYSFKASYEWFRCHPGNDDKGIWCNGAASAREGDYINLS